MDTQTVNAAIELYIGKYDRVHTLNGRTFTDLRDAYFLLSPEQRFWRGDRVDFEMANGVNYGYIRGFDGENYMISVDREISKEGWFNIRVLPKMIRKNRKRTAQEIDDSETDDCDSEFRRLIFLFYAEGVFHDIYGNEVRKDEILSFVVTYSEKKKKDKDSIYVPGSPVWVQCGVDKYIEYSVVGVEKDYPYRYLVENCDEDQDRTNFCKENIKFMH